MRPLACIVVENSCGGDERNHLEQRIAEGIMEPIVVVVKQYYCYCNCGKNDKYDKQPQLKILEERLYLAFEEQCIEQGETNSRKEHERYGGIVYRCGMEITRRGIVSGETSRGSYGHGIVNAVKYIHS